MQLPSLSSGCEIAQFFVRHTATSPLFLDNLHFEHLDKCFKVDLWLTLLSKCSKWRLSKKRGLVADGCNKWGWVAHDCLGWVNFLSFNFTPPKRRFWTVERTSRWVSSKHFQGCESRIWSTNSWKVLRKYSSSVPFSIPKPSFGSHIIVTFFAQRVTS